MARPRYTRVAVAQLDFVPAAEIKRRSLLEDPLFELDADSLLPETGSLPRELHEPLAQLRARVRQAYVGQYWRKLQAVIGACRGWNVRLLVLPEYSVPWELLGDLADAAGDMVIVAGTHTVERAARRSGIYAKLGWAELPEAGIAVAPVLHRGRLLGLQAKLSAAKPEQGSLKLGRAWTPVNTDGAAGPGLPGHMGVMICLDFLYRERDTHREQIGPGLDSSRFLAVPSYTPWHSTPEFAAKAWEEARRYGRPVLYANVASGGGSSLFVDEGGLVDLRRFPDHAGYLDRGDEGVIVADVDLGYQWTGRSTRYDEELAVVPFAAASLVYRHDSLSDRYAAWSIDFHERLGALALDDALTEIEHDRELLLEAGAIPGAQVRRARLERLFLDRDHITGHADLRRFLAEVVLPPDVVPLRSLRAALAAGALKTVRVWAGTHRTAGLEAVERRLLDGARELHDAGRSSRTDAAQAILDEIVSSVGGPEGRERAEVVAAPAPRIPSDLRLDGLERAVRDLFLEFRAEPGQLRATTEAPPVAPPSRRHASWLERVWLLRRAQGAGDAIVVGVSLAVPGTMVKNGYVGGLVMHTVPGQRQLFAPEPDGTAGEIDRKLAADVRNAVAEICSDVASDVQFVGEDAIAAARAELCARFTGARQVIDQLVSARLRELDQQSVPVEIAVEGERQARPGIEALRDWSRGPDSVGLLLGPFGSGKSTLLGQFCQMLWTEPAPRPILVELAGTHGEDPLGMLLVAAGREPASDADRAALALLIRSGDVLPCFDGFDEMATNIGFEDLSHRLAELLGVVRNGGKVLISSRDHYFTSEGVATRIAAEAMAQAGVSGLWRATVQPFAREQVQSLVEKVKAPADVAGVQAKIETTYDLRDLVRTPLLLTMVLQTIDEIDPGARVGPATLYERYLDRWLAQADAGEPDAFSRERKHAFAEQLARELWRSGARSMAWADLHRAVKVRMAEHMPDELSLAAAILEMQGGAFFVREGKESFRFAHNSFLEYFFARSLLKDLAHDVAGTLTTRPITPEVGAFVAALLRMAGSGSQHPAIVAVRHWLSGGRIRAEGSHERTSGAAANALRLLRTIGRSFDEPGGWVPEGADLRGVDLRGENLSGCMLRRADFTGAWLVDVDLEDADLEGVKLVDVRMAGARLWKTRLDGVRIEGADLLQVEAHAASLRGVTIVSSDLRQSSWSLCDWSGAVLEQVQVGPTWATSSILDPDGRGLRPPVWECQVRLVPGHTEPVNSVAWSPDGEWLASASDDKTVRVWSASGGRALATLVGHSNQVMSVAWSPDGNHLASASGDHTVRVWSAHDGRALATCEGHSSPVTSVAWSPDGNRLASASDDHTVRIWSAHDGQALATFEGHSDAVLSVAWSPDGERLASASLDHTVLVWSAQDRRVLATLEGHSDAVTSVAWSPDGEHLASVSDDHTVQVWSAGGGQALHTVEGHSDSVLSVAWSPDGERLASASWDNTVRVWSAHDGGALATFEGHSDAVTSVAWSPDGKRLASAADDHTVRVWSVHDGQTLAILEGHFDWGASVAWSPDGERLASASDDYRVRLWSVHDGQTLATLKGHSGKVRSMAWSPDGERLASASEDKTVRVWSARDGRVLTMLEGHSRAVLSVAWSPDGERLASASDDHTMRVWSARDGRVLATLEAHEALSVAWSPDGERLASASLDHTVQVWSAQDGRALATFEGHSDAVTSVAWSPDGERLASASDDCTVRVWSADDEQALHTLEGHSDSVLSVAWSPDGERLASTSWDNTVRVWSAGDGRALAILEGHSDAVTSVAWSPDGERLASASDDNTVRLWNTRDGRALATIEFAGGSSLLRVSTGHFVLRNEGAAPAMLAIATALGASVTYVPLAGLRDPRLAEGVSAGLRGAPFPSLIESACSEPSRPWDGQVRRLTIVSDHASDPVEAGS